MGKGTSSKLASSDRGRRPKSAGRASPQPLVHGAPTPPPRRRHRARPAAPRRGRPPAGGVGSTLKTTDAALVIYLADAWAARAVGRPKEIRSDAVDTVRETKALVAKLLKIPPSASACSAVHGTRRRAHAGRVGVHKNGRRYWSRKLLRVLRRSNRCRARPSTRPKVLYHLLSARPS